MKQLRHEIQNVSIYCLKFKCTSMLLYVFNKYSIVTAYLLKSKKENQTRKVWGFLFVCFVSDIRAVEFQDLVLLTHIMKQKEQ